MKSLKQLQMEAEAAKMTGYLLAAEMGFLCHEKGWNLQRTLEEVRKTVKGEK